MLNPGLLDLGRALPTCPVCLWGLFDAFVSSLWNEVISFDLVQFKLSSQSESH